MLHVSVLLKEAIENLSLKEGDVFVDATLGNGGHSEYVAKAFGKKVKIISIDADPDAIERSKKRLSVIESDITYVNSNFRNLESILADLNIDSVDKILFDLGLSSNQLEESGRGFTFQKDEPLIMSFDKDLDRGLSAREIVNEWNEEKIEEILKIYGEERFAKRIAKGIVYHRERKPIETTFDLVEIIKKSYPRNVKFGKMHVATKTFQALRIAVNDEVSALNDALNQSVDALRGNGRIAIISFHSIEDRIVKRTFNAWANNNIGNVITKKPIIPDDAELKENPRSRSAKLRIFEKK